MSLSLPMNNLLKQLEAEQKEYESIALRRNTELGHNEVISYIVIVPTLKTQKITKKQTT